jgi:ribonuclease T1
MHPFCPRKPGQRATSALVCSALLLVALAAGGRETAQTAVSLSVLPAEAKTTLEHIRTGGAFPYERDGVVFGNREGLLPAKPRGYYHEYTVPTPGVKSRGARRIVCGGHAATLAECYYSDDHYQSFRRIQP